MLYFDVVIQIWLIVFVLFVNLDCWQELIDIGIGFCIVYYVVLFMCDQNVVVVGVVFGQVIGLQLVKLVDKVSVSYDMVVVVIKDGGFWNSIMYGICYFSFVMMMGVGGMQLQCCCCLLGEFYGQYES